MGPPRPPRGRRHHRGWGHTYAVGDRVVALSPNPAAGIVTSQQLTITALTPERIDARTDHGRAVTLSGTAIDTQHFGYGYALTLHRAQGATYDRTHYLAAGGGRELAYVGLSRARDHTIIYAVADDPTQAVGDLQAEWSVEQHQRWITDTAARIGHHPESARAPTIPRPPQPTVPLEVRRQEAYQRLTALEGDLRDLSTGSGRWQHTAQGQAARHRNDAVRQLNAARRRANAPTAKRRDRRAAARSLDRLAAALDTADRRWQEIGQPVADRLRQDIARTRTDLDRLQFEALRRRLDRGPDLVRGRDLSMGLGL